MPGGLQVMLVGSLALYAWSATLLASVGASPERILIRLFDMVTIAVSQSVSHTSRLKVLTHSLTHWVACWAPASGCLLAVQSLRAMQHWVTPPGVNHSHECE
jgi:hypothetical protein